MKIIEGTKMTTLVMPNYTHNFQFIRSADIVKGIEYYTWIYNGALLLSDSVEEISMEVFENAKYFFQKCNVTVIDIDKNGEYLTYTLEGWRK